MKARCLQLLALFGILASSFGEQAEEGPTDLIRLLTKRPLVESLLGCGPLTEYRAIAKRLSDLGAAAVPAIEATLDSIESEGRRSEFAPNAGWLLLVYARIQGPAAAPRFKRLVRSTRLTFLRLELDEALALALDLTSYVDGLREPGPEFSCRSAEPRDALNQLVSAWERDDRHLIEASLGPNARAALKSQLSRRTWPALRAELWRVVPRSASGVGYRFEVSGRWSEPEETLRDVSGEINQDQDRRAPQLDTAFKNGSGADCGRHTIQFVGITRGTVVGAAPLFPDTYLVDNSDIIDVLRLISSCAASQR